MNVCDEIKYSSKGKLKCNIWAVTAMNENDLQVHLQDGLLDGITVKPISLKTVEKIVTESGI